MKYKPRKIFKQNFLQKKFDKKGYVVVPFIDETKRKQLLNVFQDLQKHITPGFHAMLTTKSIEYKVNSDKAIREICNLLPEQYLHDYQVLFASFVIKQAGENSYLHVHQDCSFTDDYKHTTINCWFPLTQLAPNSAPLCVMQGTHHYMGCIRGSHFQDVPLPKGLRKTIEERYFTPLLPKLGESVMFNNCLVHGSPANLSNQPRIAISLCLIPKKAQALHLYRYKSGKVEKFEVDNHFYTHFTIGEHIEDNKYVSIKSKGYINYKPPKPIEKQAIHYLYHKYI